MCYPQYQMILHSDREGNDCIWKLRCHCIQIMHSDNYSVYLFLKLVSSLWKTISTRKVTNWNPGCPKIGHRNRNSSPICANPPSAIWLKSVHYRKHVNIVKQWYQKFNALFFCRFETILDRFKFDGLVQNVLDMCLKQRQ